MPLTVQPFDVAQGMTFRVPPSGPEPVGVSSMTVSMVIPPSKERANQPLIGPPLDGPASRCPLLNASVGGTASMRTGSIEELTWCCMCVLSVYLSTATRLACPCESAENDVSGTPASPAAAATTVPLAQMPPSAAVAAIESSPSCTLLSATTRSATPLLLGDKSALAAISSVTPGTPGMLQVPAGEQTAPPSQAGVQTGVASQMCSVVSQLAPVRQSPELVQRPRGSGLHAAAAIERHTTLNRHSKLNRAPG